MSALSGDSLASAAEAVLTGELSKDDRDRLATFDKDQTDLDMHNY